MQIGVVLQCDPPASRLVELARRAEEAGFSHVWTFDSPILWQEPFVIYSQILAATSKVTVGPMVTNPLSRDWTVTASLFATLNDMFGNRTICGIGRGDSAVRVPGGAPSSLTTLAAAMRTIRSLARGGTVELNGRELSIPWVRNGSLEVWMAAYGPKALDLAGREADGLILQLADAFLVEWSTKHALEARAASGPARTPFTVCAAAPAYVGENIAHQRDQTRWFGGMVGNHVADLVARYGVHSVEVPRALTDYIEARPQYDYSHHGRAGNPSTDFVPDEVIDRFCILGPAVAHVERLEELASLGVGQFALYLQHDAKEETLEAYGSDVIPALA
ncbi:MAG TPA: TIGR03842 family LLM class F420-dependent oxidoreductase [Acidimicrobiales bacterium]|nr:TIGR03842 family LLM class F420-dependent oxidoreductase [Acidimicrobiales bacterium]